MKTLSLFFLWWGLSAQAQTLVCTHYVTQEIPFCSVTLKILEDGSLDTHAEINHQGQKFQTLIEELPKAGGEWFRLNLDADKPGKEIEMRVQLTETGEGPYPSVMINHEAPFAKEMKGNCLLETSG